MRLVNFHEFDALDLNIQTFSALSTATLCEFLIFGCILGCEWMKAFDFRSVELVTINGPKLN